MPVTGNSVSLVGISESDQINKDSKFLDAIKKVSDEHETSVQFTAARNQLENAQQWTDFLKETNQKRKKLERDFFHFVLHLLLLCTLLVLYYFFITVVPKKNCVIFNPTSNCSNLPPLLLVFAEISTPHPPT